MHSCTVHPWYILHAVPVEPLEYGVKAKSDNAKIEDVRSAATLISGHLLDQSSAALYTSSFPPPTKKR